MPDGDHTHDPRGRHDGKTPVDQIPPVVHIIHGHRRRPGPRTKAERIAADEAARVKAPSVGDIPAVIAQKLEEAGRLSWVQQADEVRRLVSIQVVWLRSQLSDHLNTADFDSLRVCAAIIKQMSIEQRQTGPGGKDPTDTDDEEKLEDIAEGR